MSAIEHNTNVSRSGTAAFIAQSKTDCQGESELIFPAVVIPSGGAVSEDAQRVFSHQDRASLRELCRSSINFSAGGVKALLFLTITPSGRKNV